MNTSKSGRPKYTRNSEEVKTIGSSDLQTLINLVSSYTARERARIALSFLPYFKQAKLADIIGVDRQLIFSWIKRYPDLVKKGGENK